MKFWNGLDPGEHFSVSSFLEPLLTLVASPGWAANILEKATQQLMNVQCLKASDSNNFFPYMLTKLSILGYENNNL